jgi:septal ring factor EnvC (AmiA/AmiB activator)
LSERKDDGALVEEVRVKTQELERLLEDFSARLRRMRQRNRQVEDELASFERDLDRLRRWLAERG